MRFKLFYARTRKDLEKDVNEWLEGSGLPLESIKFQYSTTPHDDSVAEITEYTLAVFYRLFEPIG